jgi:molybdopterin converting factor small subunit
MSPTIEIKIRSYDVISASLPDDLRLNMSMGEPIALELVQGSRVIDIFKKVPWLGRPLEDTIVVFVNGEAQTLNCELKSGDTIDLMTPSGGG